MSDVITREQRVRHIAQLMSRGKWLKSYRQRCKLASLWGVEDCTVRRYAAEAHQLLATDPEERDQLRTALSNKFLGIAEKALSTPNAVTGVPDYRSAIQALESYARFSSVMPAEEKQSVTLPPVITIVHADSTPERAAVESASGDKTE